MELREYKRFVAVIALGMMVLVAFGVVQNSIFVAVVAVTIGVVLLHFLRKSLTEVVHDERTVIIQNKAGSATLAIVTVSMVAVGFSLVFMSGWGMGDYEQAGYLLVYLANLILILNALLGYYYRKKLGG